MVDKTAFTPHARAPGKPRMMARFDGTAQHAERLGLVLRDGRYASVPDPDYPDVWTSVGKGDIVELGRDLVWREWETDGKYKPDDRLVVGTFANGSPAHMGDRAYNASVHGVLYVEKTGIVVRVSKKDELNDPEVYSDGPPSYFCEAAYVGTRILCCEDCYPTRDEAEKASS